MTGPRYTIVASALRTRIATGDIEADGSLESESELCARHGVSRITVRRALDELRRDGLVESRQGAGWYATQLPAARALAMVGSDEEHAFADRPFAPLPVLEFGFVPAGEAARLLGLSPRSKVLRYVRLHESDGRPYELETGFIPAELGRSLTQEDIERRRIWATLRGLGVDVTRVTQTITATTATSEQARLLGVRTGDALLFVERIGLSGDRPVDISHHHYPGGRVVLDMEFHQEYVRAADTAGMRLMPMKPARRDR